MQAYSKFLKSLLVAWHPHNDERLPFSVLEYAKCKEGK